MSGRRGSRLGWPSLCLVALVACDDEPRAASSAHPDEGPGAMSGDASEVHDEPDMPIPPPAFSGLHLTGDETALTAARLALGDAAPRVTFGGDRPTWSAQLVIEVDSDCAECFSLEVEADRMRLRGGSPLGLAHGLSEALEHAGYEWQHPLAPVTAPRSFSLEPATIVRREPEIALRGLHLHTLHPIEALDAYWIPGPAQLERARRINRWIALNGGNFVEWVALGDIQRDAARHAAWVPHTRAIIEDARSRGLSTGLGIQLFGQSNLQRAFDLIDDTSEISATRAEQAGEALDLITPAGAEGVAFDIYNLSFGEFSGAEPALFVESVNMAWHELQARAPDARMTTTIHVGDSEDLRVTYQGQEMLYYFLAQFADPAVVPWVHTVMYYNLYDPAGGAYDHEEFDEHRAFLEARLAAGEPVGYFPETAYWISFDDSVPQFLPVYVTSRLLDLGRIRPQGALSAHVLFSSGWEWGYWMHDRAALRASYRGAEDPSGLFAEAYRDAALGQTLADLGAAQRQTFILDKLAPYTAGRDIYIDAGDNGNIIAAPDRLSLAEVAALDAGARRTFAGQVVGGLGALQEATARALREAGLCSEATLDSLRPCLDALHDRPVLAELRDGLIINWLRLEFARSTYSAALAHADGGGLAQDHVERADAALELATAVVRQRHGALFDAESPWLTQRWGNPTIYGYGYLFQPDSLCHWRRERNQLRRLLEGGAPADPNCAL